MRISPDHMHYVNISPSHLDNSQFTDLQRFVRCKHPLIEGDCGVRAALSEDFFSNCFEGYRLIKRAQSQAFQFKENVKTCQRWQVLGIAMHWTAADWVLTERKKQTNSIFGHVCYGKITKSILFSTQVNDRTSMECKIESFKASP